MNEPPRHEPDAALRQSYRELQSVGTERCPSLETLAGLALDELSGTERERLADHVVSCRRCSRDYGILARTDAEAKRARRPIVAWAVAAALLIACGGAILVLRSPGSDETTRGASQVAAATIPSDGEELQAAPTEFRWPDQAQSEGYRVKLFSASGEAMWESERVKQNHVRLPPLPRSRLSAGRSYFWVVEADLPLEKTRLGPFRFTLRPRG